MLQNREEQNLMTQNTRECKASLAKGACDGGKRGWQWLVQQRQGLPTYF